MTGSAKPENNEMVILSQKRGMMGRYWWLRTYKLVGLLQVYVFGYDKEKLPDWQIVSTNSGWLGITALAGLLIPVVLIWGCDSVKYKLKLRKTAG